LGDGYVSLVQSAFLAGYPDYELKVLNMGVAGDTVRDLQARWDSDVVSLRPDWLTVFIGINDVWRHFSLHDASPVGIGLDEYATTLGDLVAVTLPGLSGLVLMTPYYLQPDLSDPMRQVMDHFGAAVHRLAAQHGSVVVDTQAAFDRVMGWVGPPDLAGDGVHVAQAGHMILARAVLDGLQFDWSRKPPEREAGERR
jgi:lysophospholipase L1-like esterase